MLSNTKDFKKYVLSNMSEFVEPAKDVKYEVHKQINQIVNSHTLYVLIREDVIKRMKQLISENTEFKKNIQRYKVFGKVRKSRGTQGFLVYTNYDKTIIYMEIELLLEHLLEQNKLHCNL